jgi:two-component system, NtrC family, sensor kinase
MKTRNGMSHKMETILGLSLSYGMVQKHQGRIEVAAEVGQGANFRVILPIEHSASDHHEGSQPA